MLVRVEGEEGSGTGGELGGGGDGFFCEVFGGFHGGSLRG